MVMASNLPQEIRNVAYFSWKTIILVNDVNSAIWKFKLTDSLCFLIYQVKLTIITTTTIVIIIIMD